MKVRKFVHTVIFTTALMFGGSAFAEYYVVNPNGPNCIRYSPCYRHHAVVRHVRHVYVKPVVRPVVHHYVRHTYHRGWCSWRSRHCCCCYDPDLTTGDDDPCIDPNMDIDE